MREINQEFLREIEDCGTGRRFVDKIPPEARKNLKNLVEFCLNDLNEDDIHFTNYLPQLLNKEEAEIFLESYLDESIKFLDSEFKATKKELDVIKLFKEEILESKEVSESTAEAMNKVYWTSPSEYDDVFSYLDEFDSINEFISEYQQIFSCSTNNKFFFEKVMLSFYEKIVSTETKQESSSMTTNTQANLDKIAISKNGTVVVRLKVGENQYKVNQFHNEVVNDLVKQTSKVKQIMNSFNDVETMAGRTARRHFKALVEGVSASTLR